MKTCTLLLRCQGPMQAWGTRSRFGHRDTGLEPSKSGVVGLLAAALGRDRAADLSDLAALFMAVRVDKPGHVEVDYQTIGGGRFKGQHYGVSKADGSKPETALSKRYYLADADFLVALAGDAALLERAHQALARPRWPLYLGRKGYAPSTPLQVPGGLLKSAPMRALQAHAWPAGKAGRVERLRAVIECTPDEPGDRRLDVPVSFETADRRYATRNVRYEWLTAGES